MGGSSVDASQYIKPPDDTLALAQLGMAGSAGAGALNSQNQLLQTAAGIPVETWAPDVWGKEGAQVQAGQIAQINAQKAKELEMQQHPHTAHMREELPKQLDEQLGNDYWQKQMNEWARTSGLAGHLATGTMDGTVGKSGYFDSATKQGADFRHGNQQAAGGYLNSNPITPAGLSPSQIISTDQAAKSGAVQARNQQKTGVLQVAHGNQQSTTDWINSMMGAASGAVNQHNQNWQKYDQALLTGATNNAASDNSSTGAYIGAAGSAAGAAAACWVAREVYGRNNPKWRIFRDWLEFKAPPLLYSFYLIHGQEFAEWVSDKPTMKRIVRWFMDRAVNSMLRKNIILH